MGTRQGRVAPPVADGGLARLLDVETRLEALLAARQSEAAAVVAAARQEGEARLAQLGQELEELARERHRELDRATALRLANLQAAAAARLARLAELPMPQRQALVEGVVEALLREFTGQDTR